MITTLHIKNMGIIDEICVEFNDGLNVLTGETGAGKSLILEAISLVCGGRFSKELVRKGCEFLLVEATFFLPNNHIFESEEITISRKIYTNGRNVCKINSNLVSVNELSKKMRGFIDIHSQNENQEILNVQNHIVFLDNFAGDNISSIKKEYSALYNEYLNVKVKLQQNYGDDREKQRKISLLEYQLNEIEEANLKENEEEELENKKKILSNSEKIYTSLMSANDNISVSILPGFDDVIKSISKISDIDSKYGTEYDRLQELYYNLQDISSNLYSYSQEIDFSNENLEEIEKRLDLIYDLKRKYGNSIAEIFEYKKYIKQELEKIENLENYILELKNMEKCIKEKLEEKSNELNKIRNDYSKKLEEKINNELDSLDMKSVRAKIEISYDESKKYNENGLNKVRILVSTNIGSDFLPIEKIASGGEISRIMLAIKNVLSEYNKSSKCIIFDEIDTGISGIAVMSVSEKLKNISKSTQVLCVTHQAALTAKADSNYYIYKISDGKKTISNIKKLDENEVIGEIARISYGEKSEVALKYAKDLREKMLLKVG